MAQIYGLGRTIVVTPGTLVPIVVPSTINPPSVHAFIVEALPGNAGRVYLGLAGLLRSTLANVIIVLPIPTSNFIPTFSCSITSAANPLRLDTLFLDADTANDGVLISAIVW